MSRLAPRRYDPSDEEEEAMSCRADRNIIYSFVKSAIDDAQQHLREAYAEAFNCDDVRSATDKGLRAISSIREAEEHMAVSSEIISKQKKKVFEQEIVALKRALWCLTKDISKKTRTCYVGHEQTGVLRMHFLAYSFEPRDNTSIPEVDVGGLY